MNKQIIQFRYGINPKLKELVLLWKMHNNYKGYFIIGPKNSGKTAFLKDLEKALDKTTYITGHQMIERLYDDVRKNRLYFFSNNPQEVLLIIYESLIFSSCANNKIYRNDSSLIFMT